MQIGNFTPARATDSLDPFAFLVSQVAHIETTVNEIRYPDIRYPALVPVDTSANEWARTILYFSTDRAGKAEWFGGQAQDMPYVDVWRNKHEQMIEMAAIGYTYNLEELANAQRSGQNLSAERAAVAREVSERFVDNIVLNGSTQHGWTGLFNATGVTVSTAAATGTGSATAWSTKSADNIRDDINDALTAVWTSSKQTEMANTILLPPAAYSRLLTLRIENTLGTALDFIQRANIYTAETGQPLLIRAVRGLEDAGASDVGRMVVYRRDPNVLKLHFPMRHRFLPVWQKGPMTFEVPGIFRLGGLEVRRPLAMRYVDGITT